MCKWLCNWLCPKQVVEQVAERPIEIRYVDYPDDGVLRCWLATDAYACGLSTSIFIGTRPPRTAPYYCGEHGRTTIAARRRHREVNQVVAATR